MNTIKLSTTIIETYKNAHVDISYALSELVGAVAYDCSSKIARLPIKQDNTVDYPIEDHVYEELQDKFDGLVGIDPMAEILLWSNYCMGAKL